MRKFTLINSLGNTYELTNKLKNVFLNNPSGLGFIKEITIQNFSESDSIIQQRYNMPEVSGELIFYANTNNAYQDYFEFTDFIANSPIYLEYLPPNLTESYYIECVVTNIDKTEVSYTDKVMHCPVIFRGTTLWKKSNETRIIVQKDVDADGKHYQLERPYYYQGQQFSKIDIDVRADLSIPFEIRINGSVTNPQIIATQNGVDYGIIKLNGTFDSVYINTDDRDEEIKLMNNNSVLSNPYSYQDYSVADGTKLFTFFNLKVGKTTLNFNCQNIATFDGTIEIAYKEMRATI